jgi:isopentenyl-diphosphate delta-isomerase
MVDFLNAYLKSNTSYGEKVIIISGGVENIIDGFFLQEKLHYTSLIGQAKNFLSHAENYEEFKTFVSGEIEGLKIAKSYLEIKHQEEER